MYGACGTPIGESGGGYVIGLTEGHHAVCLWEACGGGGEASGVGARGFRDRPGVVPRVLGVVPGVLGVVPRVLGVVPRVIGCGPQGTRGGPQGYRVWSPGY